MQSLRKAPFVAENLSTPPTLNDKDVPDISLRHYKTASVSCLLSLPHRAFSLSTTTSLHFDHVAPEARSFIDLSAVVPADCSLHPHAMPFIPPGPRQLGE